MASYAPLPDPLPLSLSFLLRFLVFVTSFNLTPAPLKFSFSTSSSSPSFFTGTIGYPTKNIPNPTLKGLGKGPPSRKLFVVRTDETDPAPISLCDTDKEANGLETVCFPRNVCPPLEKALSLLVLAADDKA